MSGDAVLGVDGGGTKTLAALLDRSGRVLRTARAGGTNPIDNPKWRSELEAALRPLTAAGATAVVAALPAHGEVEAISAAQREAIATAFPGRPVSVLNDVDAAQIGAFAGEPGILILSGTGSMAWARDAEGRSHRVGGWGDVLGDEGSAFWIGQRVLWRVTQSLDGRAPASGLTEAVFMELELDLAHPSDGIEGWVSGLDHPRSAIAALAPLALRLAGTGDGGAREIADAAAAELARHVTAIEQRAGVDAPWSYAGGTFSSPYLLAKVAERIGRAPVAPRLPPIGGALLAAARLADWPTDDTWIARVHASLEALPADQTTLELIPT